jgi:hypothetical protein
MAEFDERGARGMADRLLALPWRRDESRLRSHAALVREYLRRAALWAAALDGTESWPFADLADRLGAEPVPPDLLDRLNRGLESAGASPRARELSAYAVRWAGIPPALTAPYGLPDPYEPLVRLFERGGDLQAEHGFVYVFHVGVPAAVKGWRHFARPEPFTELDDQSLDALD